MLRLFYRKCGWRRVRKGFATIITRAIYDSIDAGLININHFEELGIFNSNIKEDRISDTTINILKDEFILYTQNVCARHQIPLQLLPCRVYDQLTKRWMIKRFQLPVNPFNNGPIILIPKKYLASINALNSDDFLDYCWQQFDDSVKDQLNVAIKSGIDKAKIIEIARNNPDWVNQYLTFKETQKELASYNLLTDPDGVYLWHAASEIYASQNPQIEDVVDRDSFLVFLNQIAMHFHNYIEHENGNLTLLDSENKPKKSRAAQLLLYGLLKNYCNRINCKIDLKEAGKGMINFKFSNHFEVRSFLEVKYARNKDILKTFENFLVKATNGDEIINGYYCVIGFKSEELLRAVELEEDLLQLAEDHNFILKYMTIDASI
jgi:hypothetical protein